MMPNAGGASPVEDLIARINELGPSIPPDWMHATPQTLIVSIDATLFGGHHGVLAVQRKAEHALTRVRDAGANLRLATEFGGDTKAAVHEYLAALADALSFLIELIAATLLLLLSRSLGEQHQETDYRWKPEPIDASPQIAPRGPNHAFPVATYRGGHLRSALGSVVLTA
ncbi:hypothetical protein [Streptomyces sirii]|uniref:hypothetical protein n=1 Tax=Streptomyces sirii TaxID=3127701 RepID=UPI003D359B51